MDLMSELADLILIRRDERGGDACVIFWFDSGSILANSGSSFSSSLPVIIKEISRKEVL